MAEQETLLQVNYYKDTLTIASSATALASTPLFDRPAGTTGAANDLNPNGILPDDRHGQITSLLVRVHNPRAWAGAQATDAESILEAEDAMNLIESLWLTLYVNNVEHTRGPIQAFPHPPIWHTMAYTQASNSDQGIGLTQNGGYMLFFQNVYVGPQKRVRVNLESRHAWSSALSQNTLVTVMLQVLDERSK